LQKVGINSTCQTLWEDVRTNESVTNETTPHAYGKAMLVVAFDSSMWIITTPQMGVSCIIDSIAGKMDLVGEQNVTNHTGVRINPTAQINRLHMSAGSRC
jgi:hypothetical protein